MEQDILTRSSQRDFSITGVSYIGKPRSHTAMFVTKKVEHLLENLRGISECLIFAETGITVEPLIFQKNCFNFSSHPQLEYAKFVNALYKEHVTKERKRKYTLQPGGYYLGENVTIGENSYIEPQCLIGHDVVIGENACILCGTVIKNSVIGDDFLANEHAVIGSYGFTMTEDEQRNKIRIPTLGRVMIGNHVEVGAHDNISCGTGSDTVIEDYVKIDALTYIGHDVFLGRNTEITAGNIIGGFARLEPNVYAGINSNIRNRIVIGENSIVGMGSNVTKSISQNVTVVGNPARNFDQVTGGGKG